MKEVKLKAKVSGITMDTVYLEFGRVQAAMNFSDEGKIQRTLRLKEDDEVQVIIRK